ncbi:chromate efflux transporter [Roseomonas genomospecies 6]|uniref:Chromate transporter n=1 Tax=Roseomonas genomospecies 6 TaxID=214106 RepID=A0A9W7KP46_9PROT|nr:chromate efflux transporter [Roseomonas genomospecies 6]KAA0676577.1 chromate transporter [Roseomonas genomospecies 6]
MTRADSADTAGTTSTGHGVGLWEAVRVWARIALLSFGGPAGQIAMMHRILVDEKRWIGEERFLHALNYCMLLPGPEAQQLAVYIGWLMHRTVGGLIAGVLFVLPGALSIMALSILYATLGNTGPVEGLFFGLKAAVLAVVLDAVVRVGRRTLKNGAMVTLSAAAFLAIFAFNVPFPLIILTAALIGLAGARLGFSAFRPAPHTADPSIHKESLLGEGMPDHARPSPAWSLRVGAVCLALWLGPVLALLLALGPDNTFTAIAVFFSKMAVVTFGGAYAVLAYVAQQAVETYGWMQPGEMLDGLGMAETTPGPLIMVVQFVGFLGALRDPGALPPLLAGVLGGLLTTWVTFVPCFLWIFLGAPYVEALRGNRMLGAALSAITAAVVGVILNLAVWFALHTLFARLDRLSFAGMTLDVPVLSSVNLPALLLTAAAVAAVFRFKVGMLPTLAACALAGVALRMVGVA